MMQRARQLFVLTSAVIFSALPVVTHAFEYAHTEIDYKLCFTPPQPCTGLIVDTINQAKKSIYVQAYSFTSAPIMHALSAAFDRGVEVKVLLDKSQKAKQKYSSLTYLRNNNIPVWIDDQPDIAHNKVMIIDEAVVITGSFNFTNAAQFRNAENVIVIKNDLIAKRYLENWRYRYSESHETHHVRHKKKKDIFHQLIKFKI